MTDIRCLDCDHIRETTEENPELTSCENCGSYNLAYDKYAREQWNDL